MIDALLRIPHAVAFSHYTEHLIACSVIPTGCTGYLEIDWALFAPRGGEGGGELGGVGGLGCI